MYVYGINSITTLLAYCDGMRDEKLTALVFQTAEKIAEQKWWQSRFIIVGDIICGSVEQQVWFAFSPSCGLPSLPHDTSGDRNSGNIFFALCFRTIYFFGLNA